MNDFRVSRDALNSDEPDKDILNSNIPNSGIESKVMQENNELIFAMIRYYAGDPKRINHFLKVNAFGKLIASGENVDSRMYNIIDVATITHDIGIKVSEENMEAVQVNIRR